MKKILVVLPLLAALGFGQGLLVNGDFEQDLTVGWTFEATGTAVVNRDSTYHPDPDYEVMDSLIYFGNSKLYQIVDVPGTRLVLSFSAKFEIYGASSTCWPVASVVVGYYDDAGALLGETRFYYHDAYCTWVPSNTMSLVEVTSPDWNQYSLDVADELNRNLPGVNPSDVRRVGVALFDTTAGG